MKKNCIKDVLGFSSFAESFAELVNPFLKYDIKSIEDEFKELSEIRSYLNSEILNITNESIRKALD